MKPKILEKNLTTLLETKFLNVYEYPFGEDGHYYTATRRKRDNLVMLKSDDEYKEMLADAVTCAVIITGDDVPDQILMNYEFRYACAQFIMAPPAGLIDPEDKASNNPLLSAARREIYEETGIEIKDTDKMFVVNPLLFSSPGMTDESNAIVCAVIDNSSINDLNHSGSVGAEVFNGFELLDKAQAKELLKTGRDKNGNFYSVYTWITLMCFVSDMWKE